MDVNVVGMPWYQEEDYAKLRGLFVDGEKLHAAHADGLAAATLGESKLVATGIRVVRVEILPTEFAAWCQSRSLPLDAQARMAFANEVALRSLRPS